MRSGGGEMIQVRWRSSLSTTEVGHRGFAHGVVSLTQTIVATRSAEAYARFVPARRWARADGATCCGHALPFGGTTGRKLGEPKRWLPTLAPRIPHDRRRTLDRDQRLHVRSLGDLGPYVVWEPSGSWPESPGTGDGDARGRDMLRAVVRLRLRRIIRDRRERIRHYDLFGRQDTDQRSRASKSCARPWLPAGDSAEVMASPQPILGGGQPPSRFAGIRDFNAPKS